VAQAIHFGATRAAQGEFAIHDVFLVESNPKLKATISVSTVFERLAVYASQQTHRVEPIDPAFVDIVRNLPIFETHYALDIMSPHKLLRVVRFWPVGSRAEMSIVDQEQLAKGSYRQIVAFPYRDVDYSTEESSIWSPSDQRDQFEALEKGTVEQFEMFVQKMFSKTTADIIVDLRHYH
jgi:hypothetical protein